MNLLKGVSRLFALDDETWLRHANPWSVWTRNTVLPILIAAVWSRAWIGVWSLIPIAFALAWAWLNPRLFARPASTEHWASYAVLGERVWLARKTLPVPAHHRIAPHVLSAVAGVGSVIAIWGVVELAIWPTLLGAALIYAGKLWFLDRMAWLYRDAMNLSDEYRRWHY